MFLSRKNPILLLAVVMMVSMLLLSACGSASNMDFATYMKEQPAERASIDAQLAILSADAKGSVQYVDNKAEISVSYYALTQAELDELEVQRVMRRCGVIMQDAVEQYQKDTGNKAAMEVTIYGSDAGEKI